MTLDFGTYRPGNSRATTAARLCATLAVLVIAIAFVAIGARESAAGALACDVVTASECQITTLHDLGSGGAFTVDRTLRVSGPSGEIRTDPASTLTLEITGGLVVEVGGKITGASTAVNGRGATIDIAATGAIVLEGDGSAGALISVNQTSGSCASSRAGNITLTSTFQSTSPTVTIQDGASVTANARCSAGAIVIAAPHGAVDIRGLVESASTISGTGANRQPGGGPISIFASCSLLINDTGRVSSRGIDPGADLVRLVAGGDVQVIGLVESTGKGHGAPNSPPNSCAGLTRPDKPAGSTACVEVWAGGSIVIDASGTNHGELNADVARGVGSETAWIDVFARGDITIHGPGAGPYAAGARPYAVHANDATSRSKGGIIAVKAIAGKVTLSGQAIQADGGLSPNTGVPTGGSQGGSITIEAGGAGPAGDVDLGEASVRARGANSGGGSQAGGDISIVSYNGRVVGVAPGELNTSGGDGQATPDPGSVSLRGCGPILPAVSYGGTATPATTDAASCGGAPVVTDYVVFPTASCVPIPCEGPDCPCEGPDCPCQGPDCPCEGPNCPCKGPDCPCEGTDCPCEGPDCPCTGADCPPSFCAKGTVEAVMNPATGRFPGNRGPDVVVDLRKQSLQTVLDSVNDKNKDGYIIVGVVGQDKRAPGGSARVEIELTRAYNKPFALIGCGVTLVDQLRCNGKAPFTVRASATSPEFPAGSGVTLYFQEITAKGSDSSPGWNVAGDGRFFVAVGSQSNMLGMKVVGNHNTIRNSFAKGSIAGGFAVQGDGNLVDGVVASDNAGGDGIAVTGNKNTVIRSTAGGQGLGNGGAGIVVSGTGNLVSKNRAFDNAGDGIDVSGGTAAAPNMVKGNIAGAPYRGNGGNGIALGGAGKGAGAAVDLDSNIAQNNGMAGFKVTQGGHRLRNNVAGGAGAANTACQYEVAPGNFNATGNKRGFNLIPGANGSPFPPGCK